MEPVVELRMPKEEGQFLLVVVFVIREIGWPVFAQEEPLSAEEWQLLVVEEEELQVREA
jgi:hypothetical protein